jgi:prepilin-type N-terminal cleavage/methylation domain-containing protein
MNRRPAHRTPLPRAYTLVEVLIVVAIIGMVGAVVVPNLVSTRAMVAQSATRAIVADLTTAQSEAIARQAPVFAVFQPSENRYKLVDENGQIISQQWGSNQNHAWIDFDENPRFRGVELASADFAEGPVPPDVNIPSKQIVRYDNLGSPDAGGMIRLHYKENGHEIMVAGFTGRTTVSNYTP